MSEVGLPFGRRVVQVSSDSTLLALEQAERRGNRFAEVDRLLGDLVARGLQGERLLVLNGDGQTNSLSMSGLNAEFRQLLSEAFDLKSQQARGAWFLPTEASLKVGLVNFAHHFRHQPRYATGIAIEERGQVSLADSPEALVTWSLLEPLFEQLFLPFELRGPQVGAKPREQRASWSSVHEFLDGLGFQVTSEIGRMRYGSGWSRLRADEQVRVKGQLLEAFARQVGPATAVRYRAHAVRKLIVAYYAKAQKGPVLRRRVLTRALERVLAGFFGGDWLSFLDYIGEQPHPDETIATTLPEVRVFTTGQGRVQEVAQQQGLPVEEIERILSTFWQGAASLSPTEERVVVLRRYWGMFDEIHARQAPGMTALWGLVGERGLTNFLDGWSVPYQAGLYRRLLTAEMLRDIERLWGTVMIPAWPDRIVTEPYPQALMAESFGPALKFWEGCALTAWFLCEGPYSRTNMAGLATYHAKELQALSTLECPVDTALFEELIHAEGRLGSPQPIYTDSASVGTWAGVSLEMQISTGGRQSGFLTLRDIVTRHRRAWSERFLDQYLHARWVSEIGGTGKEHNRLIAEKGKSPNLKQFARPAEAATNHWFGGDISILYSALGERAPTKPQRVALMSADPIGFAWSVFKMLGGKPYDENAPVAEQGQREKLRWLAVESLRYIQLNEALGVPPTLKDFGVSGFEWRAGAISHDVREAWQVYSEAIETAKSTPSESLSSPIFPFA